MAIELRGYSERGMVNALCDDIRRRSDLSDENRRDPSGALQTFLGRHCHFPFARPAPDFSGLARATLVVEQSFSDFGDLDLLILLDYSDGRKRAVLAEAKVATDTGCPATIRDQWDDFLAFLGGDATKTSSLFVQLYRKVRLMEQVSDLNTRLRPDAASRRWSLGNNRVVRAAARLLSEYRENPLYLAIVPDERAELESFFEETLLPYRTESLDHDLRDLDVTRWGFVTWREIDEMAQADPAAWPQLTVNFDWNRHQVYAKVRQPDGVERATTLPTGYRLWDGRRFYIAGTGERNCRVVEVDGRGRYFPRSRLVPTLELERAAPLEPPFPPQELRPVIGRHYDWEPPESEDPQPPRKSPVPVPPRRVKMLDVGWLTSAVILVDEGDRDVGDPFHVYTHHLVRP